MGVCCNHKEGRGNKDTNNKDKVDRNNMGHKGNMGTEGGKDMDKDGHRDNIGGYPNDLPCLASLPLAWNVASLFYVLCDKHLYSSICLSNKCV